MQLRRIGFYVVTLIMTFQSFSQKISFAAGANYSDIAVVTNNSLPINFTGKIGVSIALLSEYELSDLNSLLFEVSYNQFGSTYNFPPSQIPDANLNLNYLNTSGYFMRDLSKRVQIGLGPQIGYKLSKTEYQSPPYVEKNFDFGVSSNLKFLLTRKIYISGLYYLGLKKIHYLESVQSNWQEVYYNRSFTLRLGYVLSSVD